MQNDPNFVLIPDVEIFAYAFIRDQLKTVVHMRSDTPENPDMHGTGMGVKRRTPRLTCAAAWLEKLALQAVILNCILRDHKGWWDEAAVQRLEVFPAAAQKRWIFRDPHIQRTRCESVWPVSWRIFQLSFPRNDEFRMFPQSRRYCPPENNHVPPITICIGSIIISSQN